jgi:hypothetical protein
MIISLGVMSVAVGLAAHASVVQLRFFRGAGEIVATGSQAGAVGAVVAAALWEVSPSGGDVVFASDSALEIRIAVGSAVVCEGIPGRVTVPVPAPRGNTLSAFAGWPEPGDVLDVFVVDSLGAGWLRASVESVATVTGCPTFPHAAESLALTLREPFVLPAGSLVRMSRPLRLNHYRASDGLWYFGVRDWNSAALRLNTVQPVAGPLEPHSADPGRSGLAFQYFDSAGTRMADPIDPTRVALIEVRVRARSRRPVVVAGMVHPDAAYIDSSSTFIGFRNAR